MTLAIPSVSGQNRPNSYNSKTFDHSKCKCGMRTQHIVFRFIWKNPGASLKVASEELHLSYENVRQTASRIRRRKNIHLLCPECFSASLNRGTCTTCGFEMDRADIPLEVDFHSQSPVHSIQPLNGLGSDTDYDHMKLQYGGKNVRHLVERAEDPLLERCKSDLWEALKEVMPPDQVVEETTMLLSKEVKELRHRYPALARSTLARRQIVSNILKLLVLRYPSLKKCDNVTFHSETNALQVNETNE